MQEGRLGTATSRTRGLIEAYASTSDREIDADREAAQATTAPRNPDPAILSALDFLESCVVSPLDVDADTGSATTARTVVRNAPGLEAPAVAPASPTTAKTQTLAPARARRWSGLAAWWVPRGLLYWLAVGTAASAAWRSWSSPYRTAVAALVASAAVIVVELILRTIDPRIARRLGLARAREGVAPYAAGALLGLATGVVAAYIV
jgi:hypothetical protein